MMDIGLGLWHINPLFEFRLDDSANPTRIDAWRGPGAQPSEAQIKAGWLAEPRAYSVAVDRDTVPADGVTPFVVRVRAPFIAGEFEAVQVVVNGTAYVVTLTKEAKSPYGAGQRDFTVPPDLAGETLTIALMGQEVTIDAY